MKRQMINVGLRPVPTPRFQPTGFPDLGPAEYEVPDGNGGWTSALLIESAQSMANHLEAAGWDEGHNQPVDVLMALPWVRVKAADDGRYLTSSRTEAHRLASAFVRESVTGDGESMTDHMREALDLQVDTPHDHATIAKTLFRLDPMCLVHGVFFAIKEWPGQPKVARAVTGAIEAVDVRAAQSGGVKRDDVRHNNVEGGGSAEGYGMVPFHRTEYTAQTITASFSIDRGQIHSYGLTREATDLLLSLAQWEIVSFVESGMRLRTACSFEPTGSSITDTDGNDLPSSAELASQISDLAGRCTELADLGDPLMDVRWSSKK